MPTLACKPTAKLAANSSPNAGFSSAGGSGHGFTLVPSVIERWVFLSLSVMALLAMITHQQLVSFDDWWSLELRVTLWVALVTYGGRQLWDQGALSLFSLGPNQFRTHENTRCQLELVWALMPWIIRIRYRVDGTSWRYRMIWPDSADRESLRLLRVSLISMG